MKIVFLQDNGINESLAVTDISGLLKSRGHQCDLFIMKNEGRRFIRKVVESAPDLLVVPMDIWGEHIALSIAGMAKKELDAPVVFCGTYPMLFPEVIERPEVDLVALGETEFPILEIVEHIQNKEDYSEVPNLVIKRDGEIKRNPMRDLLQDLTVLPLPDRGLYFKYWYMRQMSMKRFTSGRGCPNACSFCFNSKFREFFKGKGQHFVRRKPVSRMIEEIRETQRISTLKSVHFSDDIFTHNGKWVMEFCEAYKSAFGKKLPFTCNTAVSDITEEIVAALKDANCFGIAIGVETGNEQLRVECLNKPYSDEQIIQVAGWIKKHGLFLTTFNMLALPYETIENAFETVRFNRNLHADNVRVTFLSPIPRTALVENAIRDGLLEENYENYELKIMRPRVEADKNESMKLIYALFNVALISPFFEKLIRKLLWLRIPDVLLFLLKLPNIAGEKRFFNIRLLSGFIFFYCTALPQERTKNFNNFLP